MSHAHTCTLAATPEAIAANGTTGFANARIPMAYFRVDPSECKTQLGAWLSQHVLSTERSDDASLVSMVMPVTNAGAMVANLGRAMTGQAVPQNGRRQPHFPGYMITDFKDLERVLERIREELVHIEQQVFLYGKAELQLKTKNFEWPVFGSAAGGWDRGVQTPEAYFDYCAREITQLGAVIKWAGLDRTELPYGLAKSLRKGRGLEFLAMHKNQL